jgi:endonuclease YncB( thermonuclease family)
VKLEGLIFMLFVAFAAIGVALAFVYPPKARAQAPLGQIEMRAKPLECYVPVEIISLHDGDTLHADLILPWGITLRNQTVRLIGYDAPEINRVRQTVLVTDEEITRGKAARDALGGLLANCPYIYLSPPPVDDKGDPHGRIHGSLFAVDAKNNFIDVAAWMKREGHVRGP